MNHWLGPLLGLLILLQLIVVALWIAAEIIVRLGP